MPLRVGRRLAHLQQRKAVSLRLTNVEDSHVGTTTPLSPLQWLPPRPARKRHNRAALQSNHLRSCLHIYIYMFQHSAKSLFDLWLFVLRWPHTPQAFLETSPPSRPLLLERTGQPQHRGLYPLLSSNSACVL